MHPFPPHSSSLVFCLARAGVGAPSPGTPATLLRASVSPGVAAGDASAPAPPKCPAAQGGCRLPQTWGSLFPALNLQQSKVGDTGVTAGTGVLLHPPATSERGEPARMGSRGWWWAKNRVTTSDQPCPLPSTVPWPEVAAGWPGAEEEEEEGADAEQEGGQQPPGCAGFFFWGGVSFWVLEAGAGCQGHRSLLPPPLRRAVLVPGLRGGGSHARRSAARPSRHDGPRHRHYVCWWPSPDQSLGR